MARFRRFLFSYPLANLEGHLAGFLVGSDDQMIAVQHFSVENLQSERILYELLNRALQRTRAEVRVIALGEKQIFRRIRELERNFAIGEQAPHIFEPQFDDLDQLLFPERTEYDDIVHAV